MRVYEGFPEININVTVAGGVPKAEVSLAVYCYEWMLGTFELMVGLNRPFPG